MPRKSRTNPELFVDEDVIPFRQLLLKTGISRSVWYRDYHGKWPIVRLSPQRWGLRRSVFNLLLQSLERPAGTKRSPAA